MPEIVEVSDLPPSEVRVSVTGPGRVLALAYGFFSLASGARSIVQLTVHPERALFAYILSALAAGVYLSATVLMVAAERGRWRRAATRLCVLELAGVVLVGAASLVLPQLFPDATVWSRFGSGYGYVPAVLPILALLWLHGWQRSGRAVRAVTPACTRRRDGRRR